MFWKRNLFALSCAQFLSLIGMSFFLPFLPLFLRELGLSSEAEISSWSGILFSAGFFCLSLTAPLWGSLADRWGRKLMVIRAMGSAAVVLLLTSFVHTTGQLLILRLLHGCLSGYGSAAIALIASETPEDSMGLAFGLFQSAVTSAFIVGPFIGGVLHDSIGIRDTILIGGVLSFLGTGFVVCFVREKNKPKAPSTHTVWQNAQYVFKNQTLWPAARLHFLSNMSLMAVQPILALFVGVLMELSSKNIGTFSGLVISATALSMMIGAPLWGRMVDKYGQTKILTLCLMGAGLSFFPQALVQSVPQLFLMRFVLGFFSSGIAPSLQTLISNQAPKDRRAGILGITFSFTLLGNGFGPLLGGALASTCGIRIPFLFSAVVLLLTAFLSRHLKVSDGKTPPILPPGIG